VQLSTAPVRVFLVDDHEVVRRGVAEVLEEMADAHGPVGVVAFGPGLTLYAALLLPAQLPLRLPPAHAQR